MNGALTVVGTGMTAISQFTREAEHCLSSAEQVFYLVTDVHTEHYIKQLNASAQSLKDHYKYGSGKPRLRAYQDMVDAILAPVRSGLTVCAAFYGHPGVFVHPSHEAIVQARQEGYEAKMLPGISAEDMLFADMGFDPALPGLQTYEATEFVLLKPNIDPRISMVLWQVGVVGLITPEANPSLRNLEILAHTLLQTYPASHEVVLYQASAYDNVAPVLHVFPLCDLAKQNINPLSTLYVPPSAPAEPDAQRAALLGLQLDDLVSSQRNGTCRALSRAYGITCPEKPGWVTASPSRTVTPSTRVEIALPHPAADRPEHLAPTSWTAWRRNRPKFG